MAQDEPHLSQTEASAGEKRGTMRYILGASLVGIVVVFAILLIIYR